VTELVLRIGFSLLIVFGLMWGLAKLARRPLNARRGTGELAVLGRQQLSRSTSVAVIQVAGRALVVGVTEQQISLLGETDLVAFEKHSEHRAPASDDLPMAHPELVEHKRPDGSLLNFLRDRTTRL
jgi:flagellar protein FliO/FliZ